MTTFDKREEGFEKQFAHDEELRFKATARRNRMLGIWAAEKLGLSGTQADAYAKEVIMAALDNAYKAGPIRFLFPTKYIPPIAVTARPCRRGGGPRGTWRAPR